LKEIAFDWTLPALLAGRKTVTRRDWKWSWARSFEAGELVAATGKQRRFGGRQVATIRLTQRPYRQNTAQAPASDWEAEGFAYLEEIGAKVDRRLPWDIWQEWKVYEPREMWVVRFELVSITEEGLGMLDPNEMERREEALSCGFRVKTVRRKVRS
jgi:hypothetical protein